MDDSNNQGNKKTNGSPVPLHPLFSVFEGERKKKKLIKASSRITQSRRGAAVFVKGRLAIGPGRAAPSWGPTCLQRLGLFSPPLLQTPFEQDPETPAVHIAAVFICPRVVTRTDQTESLRRRRPLSPSLARSPPFTPCSLNDSIEAGRGFHGNCLHSPHASKDSTPLKFLSHSSSPYPSSSASPPSICTPPPLPILQAHAGFHGAPNKCYRGLPGA